MLLRRMSRAALVALALSLVAQPAHAQIGGFLKKKAQEAAAGKATQQASQQAQATDPKEQPVTEETATALFKGIAAEAPKAERARALYRKADSLDKAADKLSESHQTEENLYRKKHDAVDNCRDGEFSRLSNAHEEEMSKNRNDVAMAAKMQTIALQHVQAIQKAGTDSAALEKENENYIKKLMALSGADPKADSAVVDKKCGQLPPEPAFIKQREKMQKDAEEARTQYRMVDADIIGAGAQASGMNIEQYGQWRERLIAWYRSTQGGTKPGNSAEDTIWLKHKAELQRYRAALEAYDQ